MKRSEYGEHESERSRNLELEEEDEWVGKGGSGGRKFFGIKLPPPVNPTLRRRLLWGFSLAWLIYTCGFITYRDENTVVQRLGAHVRTVGPGLHGKLPWPIETRTDVVVTQVQRIEIGFRTEDGQKFINMNGTDVSEKDIDGNPDKYRGIPREDEMLTGDTNIVILDFTVQYTIRDAAKWLFRLKEPEEALNLLSQGAMRLVVGGRSFDEVATTGRSAIQAEAQTTLQQLCDRIDFGAGINSVQLQDAHPPKEVMPSFQDVTNAREDKQKRINQAQSYNNEKLPQARGEAQKMIEDSLGYKSKRIDEAKGDTDRFLQVLVRYRQAPDITLQRLQFETIERVLPGKEQLIDMTNSGVLKLFDTQKKEAK